MKYIVEIHHGIGDVVQMTGVIESIVKADEDAYIALILNKDAYTSLFEKDVRVQKFYKIDFKEMSKLEIIKEVLRIRKVHFDYLLLSPISNRRASRVLAFLINAKVSVGEQLSGKWKRRKHVQIEDTHIVQRNENVFKALGITGKVYSPVIYLGDINVNINIEKKALSLCVGTSLPQKTWDIDKYLEVANYFISVGYQVILLGGKKEAELLESKNISEKILNLAGKLSLIQSAKVAAMSKLNVGGDTGVMHMAAAVGATTLTLFSCTDPCLHSPYSSKSYFYYVHLPCQFCYDRGELNPCTGFKCIEEIEVEEVLKIMLEILDDKVELKYKFKI